MHCVLFQIRKFIKSEARIGSSLEKMEFGKFLFLYLLSQNVNYFTFKRILEQGGARFNLKKICFEKTLEFRHEISYTKKLT